MTKNLHQTPKTFVLKYRPVIQGAVVLLVISALLSGLLILTQPVSAKQGRNGKACVVNDSAGPFNPFNDSVATGLKKASQKLKVETEILESVDEADIVANLDYFVTAGDCDLIIGLGFFVARFMPPFIEDNPDQLFAGIDTGVFSAAYPNMVEVVFKVDQAGFLAGYVAAGMSQTGNVGVFGGLPIPGVTLFMDGYAMGVDYYNTQHSNSVGVLGWDPATQSGLFSFNFTDPAIGQAITGDLYDMGADIVFPVAGETGLGALDEAGLRTAAGELVYVIGVDYDWYEILGDPDRVILTSVIKDHGAGVFALLKSFITGTLEGGTIVYADLANDGVDIAKFHKLSDSVPESLKEELKGIQAGIINESIPTRP